MRIPLRIIFAPRRSGSTLCLELIGNQQGIGITSRTISRGKRQETYRGFKPDYSIFNDQAGDKCHKVFDIAKQQSLNVVVLKEETGDDIRRGTVFDNECNYQLFPSDNEIHKTRPVFLVREPVRTFSGWVRRGWSDIESFLASYINVYCTYKYAKEIRHQTICTTYEHIVQSKRSREALLKAIYKDWQIEYSSIPDSLNTDFLSNFLFWSEKERQIYTKEKMFSFLQNNRNVIHSVPKHENLENYPQEVNLIRRQLTPLYNEMLLSSEKIITEYLS